MVKNTLDALLVEEITSRALLGFCCVIIQILLDFVREIIHSAELSGLVQELVCWYYLLLAVETKPNKETNKKNPQRPTVRLYFWSPL